LNPQLPAVLLQALLPALTMQHQLVLNGDVLPGNLPMLTLQLVEGEHAVCWHGDRLVSMTLTSGSIGLPKAAVHSAS
ncbi:o-succinylbenzoate--CoA ligase, partial [Klebsiella pneumoniae]|nr:o-succinylbenzoate--CoA ligase [Klebsiella pneumoniae]